MAYVRLGFVLVLLLALVYMLDKFADAPGLESPDATPTAASPAANTAGAQATAPALSPADKSATPGTAAAPTASDPQAELSTAIPDMVNLIQSGQLLTAFKRYIPPSYLAQMPQPVIDQLEQQEQNLLADPKAQQRRLRVVQVLQTMQGQAPELNSDRDRAVYHDESAPDPDLRQIAFIKVGGKWYLAPAANALFF